MKVSTNLNVFNKLKIIQHEEIFENVATIKNMIIKQIKSIEAEYKNKCCSEQFADAQTLYYLLANSLPLFDDEKQKNINLNELNSYANARLQIKQSLEYQLQQSQRYAEEMKQEARKNQRLAEEANRLAEKVQKEAKKAQDELKKIEAIEAKAKEEETKNLKKKFKKKKNNKRKFEKKATMK